MTEGMTRSAVVAFSSWNHDTLSVCKTAQCSWLFCTPQFCRHGLGYVPTGCDTMMVQNQHTCWWVRRAAHERIHRSVACFSAVVVSFMRI